VQKTYSALYLVTGHLKKRTDPIPEVSDNFQHGPIVGPECNVIDRL
jgi:hypothetical protein